MEDFTQAMRHRTDEQLIAVLTVDQAHYRPEAVQAAQIELERRGIDHGRYQRTETELRVKQAMMDDRAKRPLPIIFKILGFLIPGGVVLFAALFLKKDGYDRQYHELGRWAIYGVLFYTAILFLANC